MIGPSKDHRSQTILPLAPIHCRLIYLAVRFLLDLSLRGQSRRHLLMNLRDIDYAIPGFVNDFGARR